MTINIKPSTVKHGAFGKIVFLPDEDPQEYAKLRADLFAEYQPSARGQEKIMAKVAKGLWLLRRWKRRSVQTETVR